MMTRWLLIDAGSTEPCSALFAVAPNECVQIAIYNCPCDGAVTFQRVLMLNGSIPQSSGACEGVNGGQFPQEIGVSDYTPNCQPALTPTNSVTVISQPGYYRVCVTPEALGEVIVEATALSGADACGMAAGTDCGGAGAVVDCLAIRSVFQPPDVPFDFDAHRLLVFNTEDNCVQCQRAIFPNICESLTTLPFMQPTQVSAFVMIDPVNGCGRVGIDTIAPFILSVDNLCDALTAFPESDAVTGTDRAIVVLEGGGCAAASLGAIVNAGLCDALALLPPHVTIGGNLLFVIVDDDGCGTITEAQLAALVGGGGGGTVAPDMQVIYGTGAGYASSPNFLFNSATSQVLTADGTCPLPSYSFIGDPTTGMFRTLLSVNLSFANCTSTIAVGNDIALGANGSITFAPGNILHYAMDAAGAFNTGGGVNPGVAGEALISQGPGLPMIWGYPTALQNGIATFILGPTGDISVNGTTGLPGEVLTSNGPGIPAIWAAPSWAGGTFTQQQLGPDGSCAAPTYSFTSAPASGMFYDSVLGAVSIADANCTDRIDVGASIRFTTNNSLRFTITDTGEWNIGGNVGVAGQAIRSQGPLLPPVWAFNDTLRSGPFAFGITPTGDLSVNGSVGTPGQVLTSAGPGVPPVWAAPTWGGGTFGTALLGPDGSCANPTYSFTNAPTSGMFYSFGPNQVVIADNTCQTVLAVGAIGIWAQVASGDTFNFTPVGEIALNTNVGVAGEVLTSQGPGLPAIWAAASATIAEPNTQIVYGTGAAVDSDPDFTYDQTDGAFKVNTTDGTNPSVSVTTPGPIGIIGASSTSASQGSTITVQAGSGGASGTGGNLRLFAGVGTKGGDATLTAANSLSGNNDGGALTLGAGQASGNANTGGAVTITAGSPANTSNGAGGAINITGGNAGSVGSAGNGGAVNIKGGNSGTGQAGAVTVQGGDTLTPNANLDAGRVRIVGGTVPIGFATKAGVAQLWGGQNNGTGAGGDVEINGGIQTNAAARTGDIYIRGPIGGPLDPLGNYVYLGGQGDQLRGTNAAKDGNYAAITALAGPPTAAQTALQTGWGAITLDSTNNRFYAYLNGAWRYAQLGTSPATVPLNLVTDATGSAERDHTANGIVWKWTQPGIGSFGLLIRDRLRGSNGNGGWLFEVLDAGTTNTHQTFRVGYGSGGQIKLGGSDQTLTIKASDPIGAGTVCNVLISGGNGNTPIGGSVTVQAGTGTAHGASSLVLNANDGGLRLSAGSESGGGGHVGILEVLGGASTNAGATNGGDIAIRGGNGGATGGTNIVPGQIYLGRTTRLDATATRGFIWVQTINAAPTGVPAGLGTNGQNMAPVVIEQAGAATKLWIYDGAAWRSATFT